MKIAHLKTVALVILIMVCSGCAWSGKDKGEKPANELIQAGVQFYNDGNFNKALESFQQLKDWYPFSKYAILAELKIADAHYRLEQYPEAIVAYEEFERLHPRNEAIPYVIHQIGQSYFEQIDAVDRDQTPAQKALDTFQRLLRQYPQDPYAIQAGNQIEFCLQSIVGHEFYVAQFYYKRKYYKAALQRFMGILTQYPDVGYQFRALQYISECEAYQPIDRDTNQ